ncbi:MAG: hypothetical protein J6D38_07235 [Solobacterium sp.]|nr:hypothetical protein [Solobacterium sp.]
MKADQTPSWKDLSYEQKKQYFLDYYLIKVLIGIAVLIFASYTACSILRPKPSYRLTIGIYDAALSDDTKEEMVRTMQKELHTAEPIGIDDAFSSLNNDDLMRIVSMSGNGKLDGIIAERGVFEWLAGYGYFKDLTAACDTAFLNQFQDELVVCRGLAVGEGGLLQENAEGSGDPYTAGVRVTDTKLAEWLPELKEPVFGIIAESEAVDELETILVGLKQ